MKASVQYDDLKGTAAADVSDFHQSSLQNYLVGSYEQYDGDRYECYGCSIFISGQQIQPQGNIVFVCKDKIENKYRMDRDQKRDKIESQEWEQIPDQRSPLGSGTSLKGSVVVTI